MFIHDGHGFYWFGRECRAKTDMRNGEYGEYWKTRLTEYPNAVIKIENPLCFCRRYGKYYEIHRIALYIPKADYVYEVDDPDCCSAN